MKIKIDDFFFALYSKEFIISLMKYLHKNYSEHSKLVEVSLSTEEYGNRFLTFRIYSTTTSNITVKQADVLDILDYTLWGCKILEVSTTDYLSC